MKKIYLLLFALTPLVAISQTTFWTEDFGTGCNQGQLVQDYAGANGEWDILEFTSGNNGSNKFYVSATEAGMGAGNCGDGCLATGGTNATLHVGTQEIFLTGVPIPLIAADLGAAYNAGGLQAGSIISETEIRAESPVINCSGYQNIVLSFDYMEGGDADDNATLIYYTGTAWGVLEDLAKTPATCPGGQGLWTSYTRNLPAIINDLPNFRVAFAWNNNDDGVGTDPSFAVDNISLTGDITTGITEAQEAGLITRQNFNSIEVSLTDVDEEIMVVNVFDILGQLMVSEAGNGSNTILVDTDRFNGILILQVETSKGMATRKFVVQ